MMTPKKPSKSVKSTPNNVSVAGAKVHTVKSGDSLWTISKKYPGISIENLREWNGISGSNLKPGTKLKLCDCSS
jgi:membrane-bound lytic murein transglycosylase D